MGKVDVMLKLDFSNAFNTLRRDSILEAVLDKAPMIYNFCCLAYEQSSVLRFGVWRFRLAMAVNRVTHCVPSSLP